MKSMDELMSLALLDNQVINKFISGQSARFQSLTLFFTMYILLYIITHASVSDSSFYERV